MSQRFSTLEANEVGVDRRSVFLNDLTATIDVFTVVVFNVVSTYERRVVASVFERVVAPRTAADEEPLVATFESSPELALWSVY